MDGPVELALAVVAAADHGPHGPVGSERDEGRLPDAALGAYVREHRRQFVLGDGLQAWIQGRDHREVGIDTPHEISDLTHHPVGVIARPAARKARPARLCRHRLPGLISGDEARVHHDIEYDARTLTGALVIANRIVARRRFQQSGKLRRLV